MTSPAAAAAAAAVSPAAAPAAVSPAAAPAPPFAGIPHPERYLLAADDLRRRQLCAALLHGSGRSWRDRRRIWPAVVAGLVVVAVIAAGTAVHAAFQPSPGQRPDPVRAARTLADWSL
jgi:hypothetical protein